MDSPSEGEGQRPATVGEGHPSASARADLSPSAAEQGKRAVPRRVSQGASRRYRPRHAAPFGGRPQLAARQHHRSRGWRPSGQIAWWVVAFPIALFCWGSTIERAPLQRGVWAVAVAALLAGLVAVVGGNANTGRSLAADATTAVASPRLPTPTSTSVTGDAEATPTRAPSAQITEQEQTQNAALDAALDASDPLALTPAPTSTPQPPPTSTSAPTRPTATTGPVPTTGPPANPGGGIVWASAFARHATTFANYGTITGTNDVETLLDVADNGIWYAGSSSEMKVTPDGNLRVRYVPRTTGNSQGSARVQWTLKLPPANDMWLRYRFRTSPNWVAVRGGKLPGLASGPDNGNWSLRLMWRPKTTDPSDTGRLVVYPARNTDRVGDINLTGDRQNATFEIIPGQWHEVVQHVTVNPGHLDMWLDGTKVLSQDRTISNNPTQEPVDCLFFSTFYGGNDASFAPPTTTEIDFADFVVSTTPL